MGCSHCGGEVVRSVALIAIDIDSTLYDFETAFRQAYIDNAIEHGDKSLFRGAYASWVEWRSPWDVCGEEAFQAALDRVHSEEVIESRQPFEGAPDVVFKLAKEHEIVYLSNRDEDLTEITEHWLIQHFPCGRVVCTMDDKQAYLMDCQYLIDDRPKTLCDFLYSWNWQTMGLSSSVGPRNAFGLLFEYNRALTDIPELYLAPTWAGIGFYLERQGVLSGCN